MVSDSNCPLEKLEVKGITLVLLNVSEEDCGLQVHCKIYPKFIEMDGWISAPDPQVYTINISGVLSGQSIAYITDRG